MSDAPVFALDALDLTALIASRVCHDVVSPVGAINNGLEVLEEETDEEMRRIAMNLVKKSAQLASAKLQFCRLAFGAAGSAGAEIDTGDAESVARGFAESDKVSFTWEGPRWILPKNRVKLVLNLVIIALAAIPRGGQLTVTLAGSAAAPLFTLRAQGSHARIPPHVPALLAGEAPTGSIDAHVIQPFYTGMIARAAGMAVALQLQDDVVTVTATPHAGG